MSKTVHDSLTTKELHIIDKNGRTRAFVSTDPENSMPYVDLRDSDGFPRISIALDDDGNAHITMFDEASVARASIGVSKIGAGISLFANNPEHHIIFSAADDGVIIDVGNEDDESLE